MSKKTLKKVLVYFNTLLFSFVLFSFVSFNDQSGNGEIIGNISSNNQINTTTTGGGGVFKPGDFRDRVYDNENTPNRRVISYTHLRQADVSQEKRIWRRIDLREKLNQVLIFPSTEDQNGFQNRKSFFDIIKDGVKSGRLALFRDDEFRNPYLDPADSLVAKYFSREFNQKLKSLVDGTDSVDLQGNVVQKTINQEYLSTDILSFDLKEDWFFDKQRSVWDVRILGIGLSVEIEIANGVKGRKDIGWIYYPQCRNYFANQEVYNPKNDSERRTLEDFFWKRMFSSYVTKESNTFNRNVETYAKGLDAMIEADRIKSDIYKWENDLWHY